MRCIAAASLMLLAGCTVAGPALGPSGATRAQQFATQLAGPGTFLAPMPTAIVLLRPSDLNRNRSFCQAFAHLPTAQAVMSKAVIAPNVILTRWLVALPDMPPEAAANCDILVGSYDYGRAERVMQSVHLSEGQFTGPGPYLLMIVPGPQGERVVGLDGSDYAEAAFPDFIASWSRGVAGAERAVAAGPGQPGLVRSVFDLVFAVFRTAMAIPNTLLRGVIETL